MNRTRGGSYLLQTKRVCFAREFLRLALLRALRRKCASFQAADDAWADWLGHIGVLFRLDWFRWGDSLWGHLFFHGHALSLWVPRPVVVLGCSAKSVSS